MPPATWYCTLRFSFVSSKPASFRKDLLLPNNCRAVQKDMAKRASARMRNSCKFLGAFLITKICFSLVLKSCGHHQHDEWYQHRIRPINRKAKWIERHKAWAKAHKVGATLSCLPLVCVLNGWSHPYFPNLSLQIYVVAGIHEKGYEMLHPEVSQCCFTDYECQRDAGPLIGLFQPKIIPKSFGETIPSNPKPVLPLIFKPKFKIFVTIPS